MSWWIAIMVGVEAVLVVLELVVIARDMIALMAPPRSGGHDQEASLHTLAAAVDHLVAQNKLLAAELNRYRWRAEVVARGGGSRRHRSLTRSSRSMD